MNLIQVHANNEIWHTFFCEQDTTIEFLKYINETFPPQSNLKYADPRTVTKPGPAVLRPWMLPWSRQCGFKGTLEPDRRVYESCIIAVPQNRTVTFADPMDFAGHCSATHRTHYPARAGGLTENTLKYAPTEGESGLHNSLQVFLDSLKQG